MFTGDDGKPPVVIASSSGKAIQVRRAGLLRFEFNSTVGTTYALTMQLAADAGNGRLVVGTRNGSVLGVVEGDVEVWRGIPYASKPERWTPPRAHGNWSGVRNCSNFGNQCTQANGQGSEDCLFLNVVRHVTPPPAGGAAVLAWVHGGGYVNGSGSINTSSLVSLMGGRLIIVSMNYRLGVLGFLGSAALRSRDPAHGSTGCYGIQDQRAALRWVKENIR